MDILKIRDKTTGVWVSVPAIVGPKGDKGDTGEAGPKGDTGASGHTPVKGTDYWTDADKAAMVNDVLAALPTWTGGSY